MLTGNIRLQFNSISFPPPFSKQKKSIDLIVLETGLAEGRLRLRDKQLAMEWKFICRTHQEAIIQKKLAVYNRYFNIIISAFDQYAHCGARFTQDIGKSQSLSILSQFLKSNSSCLVQLADAELRLYDHAYRTTDGLVQAGHKNREQAEQAFERLFHLFKRVNDVQSKIFFGAAN